MYDLLAEEEAKQIFYSVVTVAILTNRIGFTATCPCIVPMPHCLDGSGEFELITLPTNVLNNLLLFTTDTLYSDELRLRPTNRVLSLKAD